MKFWDSSALVPLVVDEPSSDRMREIVSTDPAMVVWLLTSVELLSSIGRLGRTSAGLEDLLPSIRLDAVGQSAGWTIVTHVEGARKRAERLVGVHPLTAADALQLGAALVAAKDHPETLEFVTLDKTLARAARLEGFRVIGV